MRRASLVWLARKAASQDPRKCQFKPASLQCSAGGSDDCLTAAEVAVLDKWYGGVKNSKGEQLYPGGVPPGSEAYWPLWLTGFPAGGGALIPLFGTDFVRYMAFEPDPGPNYSILNFNFDIGRAGKTGLNDTG